MAFEAKPNTGSLFKNERKEKETHPDYKGSCLVGGSEMWMSAWLKTGANGTKFMSFSFQPKDQQAPARQAPVRQAPQADPNFDSDLPF